MFKSHVCLCNNAGHRGLFYDVFGLQMACLSGTDFQDESDHAYSSSSKDMTEFKTSLLSIPDFQDGDRLLTGFASSPVKSSVLR